MNKKTLKRKIMYFLSFIPDEMYLKMVYRIKMHMPLNLSNPYLYNEKLQWLKLYDHQDFYTKMVDKYEMKQFVIDRIGEGHVVPLLGMWDKFEDIDFSNLPNRFVLKASNDQGSVIVCNNKENLNLDKSKKILNNSLKNNFFYVGREWPYKNVKPRIIAEELLESNTGHKGLTDYKFFCFNGVPRIMYISNDLDDEPKTDFFDMDFNRLDMRMRDKNSEGEVEKPEFFEDMKKAAEKLSVGIPQLRVDFYCTKENYYVGELTFFHNGGFSKIYPEKWMKIMGDWIELPNKS